MQILGKFGKFGKFGEKWPKNGQESDIKILSLVFLDIVDPYKCAKFGEDCFRNGGATTFFDFAWAPMETTSPIHIYKGWPKNTTSGVDMINSSTVHIQRRHGWKTLAQEVVTFQKPAANL